MAILFSDRKQKLLRTIFRSITLYPNMAEKLTLERELGLTSIIAISMGAMIGSGIFILPGIAMAETGPSVIYAFIIAGLLVFPAAISIAELGTAMPEAGGDYIFIERGLGSAAGTIAGLGTWLMLMFKGALALVGGMFYLEALFILPSVESVAIVLGTILILINIFGVKQTGGLQVVMVIVMVIILSLFVLVSLSKVEYHRFTPMFTGGFGGVMTATLMVLISYGGVTKVAAVAEEIRNPERNLPLGLMLSLFVTTGLYALIVFVLVGIIDGPELAGSNMPMVDGIEPSFGILGVIFIVVAAMLALVSTANAGILTASRYPFALSRDKLIPAFFANISKRYNTPITAILVTGVAMLLIILMLPVEEIAKTAGSFQIVVYILVNVALIAFRVRKPNWYKPKFKSPAYPVIQIFGVLSGLVLLSQMDTLPLIGGVGIFVIGTLWYLFYGRKYVEPERTSVISEAITTSIQQPESEDMPYRIIVPIANPASQQSMLRIVSSIASTRPNAEVTCVNVIEVPDQTSLAQELEFNQEAVVRQENLFNTIREVSESIDFNLKTKAVVGRSVSNIILNLADTLQADEIILGWKGSKKEKHILGSNIDPIVYNASCKVSLIKASHNEIGNIVVFVGTGPYAITAVQRAAELLDNEKNASLTLVNVQQRKSELSEKEQKRKGKQIIRQVVDDAMIPKTSFNTRVIVADNTKKMLMKVAEEYDTVLIGSSRSSSLERVLFGTIPEDLGRKSKGNVIIVRGRGQNFRTGLYLFKRIFKLNE